MCHMLQAASLATCSQGLQPKFSDDEGISTVSCNFSIASEKANFEQLVEQQLYASELRMAPPLLLTPSAKLE